MRFARSLARDAGLETRLVAKVERAETVATDENIDDIIEASDAVMVARGDLGVEIGDPELVGVQKKLIRRARSLNRCVITATQMMESMIKAPMLPAQRLWTSRTPYWMEPTPSCCRQKQLPVTTRLKP